MKFTITELLIQSSRLIRAKTFCLAAALTLFAFVSISAQSEKTTPLPVEPASNKTQPAKQPFTLRVTNDQIIGISLKAQDVKLKEIAAELQKRLKIPILMTPIVEKHPITTNFSDLVLEPAMQMLAPQVYIDYEVDSTPGKQPRPLAVYLQGYNEPAPADNAVVRGNSDVMVIEGDTEDTGTDPKEKEEQELKVKYQNGLLSVNAKKQPLVVVLYAIANELNVPLEVKNEVTDPVNVSIPQTSVESVLQQLGPNIHLYVRADLQLQARRPLRMVLVGPEKKS
jgi:hypothetical protein